MNGCDTSTASISAEANAYLHGCASLRDQLDIPADAPIEAHLLGMGEHNVNFSFAAPDGRAFVLRVNVASQPFHDNQILYEYRALKAALPSGCTPEPLFVDYSDDAPGKGILVETFCAGTQLDFDDLRPGDVRCAIQMMADVHAVAPEPTCPLFRPADPLAEMFSECVGRYRDYLRSGCEEARVTRWVHAFIDATERMLEAVAPPEDCNHIINTETLPSHFLIPESSARSAAAASADTTTSADAESLAHASGKTPHQERLCAHPGHFVDWERSLLGEVAQDVAYFVSPTTTYWDSEFLFPATDIPAVLEAYWQAVDGRFAPHNFEERFCAWRMMTALKSTTWCVQAIPRYTQAAGATSAREVAHTTEKTTSKLPVYLSDEFMERIAVECFGL